MLRRLLATSSLDTGLVTVFVNGNAIQVGAGSAVIQACEMAGVEIPRFCYHKRLAIAGNCRMCLVQVEKVPKPVASCAMPVTADMRIITDSPMVKKAREGVMEFLLANHPLDCPICDQGGECDLQDQAIAYGTDRSRFFEEKRAVEDKEFGPLIKTSMNRCIHCTRCVRFMNEVAGAEELGTTGRGNEMQISTYIERTLDSELSGNIIDLCPVGALTSKPHAFSYRSWELKGVPSVDVMDALGSSIRVDSNGLKVVRILPRESPDLNEEWLSDRSRFACDGLSTQRLESPMIRNSDGKLVATTWDCALNIIARLFPAVSEDEIAAICGRYTDVETLVAAKDFLNSFGSFCTIIEGEPNAKAFNSDFPQSYLFNGGVSAIDTADYILLIGCRPKEEAPIINARIRKRWLNSEITIQAIGGGGSQPRTFDCEFLGDEISSDILSNIAQSAAVKNSKQPLIIIGDRLLKGGFDSTGDATNSVLASLVQKIPQICSDTWNGISILHRNACTVGALSVGWRFPTIEDAKMVERCKVLLLLGSDDIPSKLKIPSDAFIIYVGHHGDSGASMADAILPGAAYTEKDAIFANLEGRPQRTAQAVPLPGDARCDWQIIRALSEYCQKPLSYSNDSELFSRIYNVSPNIVTNIGLPPIKTSLLGAWKQSMRPSTFLFNLSYQKEDFYLNGSIARASPTMAKCSEAFSK